MHIVRQVHQRERLQALAHPFFGRRPLLAALRLGQGVRATGAETCAMSANLTRAITLFFAKSDAKAIRPLITTRMSRVVPRM